MKLLEHSFKQKNEFTDLLKQEKKYYLKLKLIISNQLQINLYF